jgi:hypothetical protein
VWIRLRTSYVGPVAEATVMQPRTEVEGVGVHL